MTEASEKDALDAEGSTDCTLSCCAVCIQRKGHEGTTHANS